MPGRLSYTACPSFSSNWTAHILPSWTPMSYSIPYQTKPAKFFLHALRKQQPEYSNVFPVTKFQKVMKLCPKCAYKIYHVSIKEDNKLSPGYLTVFKKPNYLAEVANQVVTVSEVSSPEQFTFVLQHAVRPLIQLKIPPHLSAPTELKFEKERLTPEELNEENCCNLILP